MYYVCMRMFRIGLIMMSGLVLLLGGVSIVYAQTTPTGQQEAALRLELERILLEIEDQKKILSKKQAEGASLERDIAILDAQISSAKLKIKAHEIAIQGLGKDINQKTAHINTLVERIEQSHASLRQLLKKTNYLDEYTIPEVMLSNKHISDFFLDLDSYFFVKESLAASLERVKQTKENTEIERSGLDKKRIQEIDAKISVETEKRIIEKSEAEKRRLLSLSKKEQQNYQREISTREARAAAIRSALFGLRDSAAIPFGKALEYAIAASQKTGVRPAFILGILTQESDLGKNIGTCNRAGDPPNKGWRAIMKPERDHQPFLRITSALGINPDTVPVSCPIGGGGWGGAMGPSQFIPSTWEIYANKIASLNNTTFADPWKPQDAIMATAVYLADLGGVGGFTAEKTAALKYYAGGNWRKPQNQFYGNQVMQKTRNIQENMIDVLQGV